MVLRSDVTQHLSTDGINLAIGPEEAYRPLFLLKGLDRRVEQDTACNLSGSDDDSARPVGWYLPGLRKESSGRLHLKPPRSLAGTLLWRMGSRGASALSRHRESVISAGRL